MGGEATGAVLHYVPGVQEEPRPWVTDTRPASMASVTCCWAAARMPAAEKADLLFDPRAGRHVMELPRPGLAQPT
eukprot:7207404-Alexandrium_andersonii.AAC.1